MTAEAWTNVTAIAVNWPAQRGSDVDELRRLTESYYAERRRAVPDLPPWRDSMFVCEPIQPINGRPSWLRFGWKVDE